MKLAAVALGGAAGCVARYLVASAVAAKLGSQWPWGTFVVNLTGSFAIGLLMSWLGPRDGARLLLVTGFLGGYTTFSAFEYELLGLKKVPAAVYAVASVAVGYAAVWLGSAVGRRFA